MRRQRRLLTQSESARPFSHLPRHRCFMALSEPVSPPYGKDLRYVSVRALCSNPTCPFLGAVLRGSHDPLCLAGLAHRMPGRASLPLSPPVDGFDPWMALSHLFVNHLSLFDGHQQGGAALRAMLGLWRHGARALPAGAVRGPAQRAAHPITRRIPGGGPWSFGRGVAVKLSMSDQAFDGGSPFLLAAVLENYWPRTSRSTRLSRRT